MASLFFASLDSLKRYAFLLKTSLMISKPSQPLPYNEILRTYISFSSRSEAIFDDISGKIFSLRERNGEEWYFWNTVAEDAQWLWKHVIIKNIMKVLALVNNHEAFLTRNKTILRMTKWAENHRISYFIGNAYAWWSRLIGIWYAEHVSPPMRLSIGNID